MRRCFLFGAWIYSVVLTAGFSAAQTLPSTSTASTQPASLPPQIENALKHEATVLSPTITIVWTERRQPPLTPSEYADATGFKDFNHHKTFAQTEKLNLTWQSDGHYLLAFHQFFQPSETDKTILRFNLRYSFDGTTFYQHGANPNEVHCVTRADFQNQATTDDYINLHYFELIGFPLPASVPELQKHIPLRAVIQRLLEAQDTHLAAVESVTLDKRPLIRLKIERGPRSPEFDADLQESDSHQGNEYFYLDPTRAYAQVRRDHFDDDGNLIFRTDCSDFQAFADRGLFLPRSVTFEFDKPGHIAPIGQLTLTVTHIDFDAIPAKKFVLSDTEPDTWFIDRFGKKQQIHILQKDGSLKLKK